MLIWRPPHLTHFGPQKGFPDETPDLQVRLEKFFGQYGKVNAVRMRRTEQKVFKVRFSCLSILVARPACRTLSYHVLGSFHL